MRGFVFHLIVLIYSMEKFNQFNFCMALLWPKMHVPIMDDVNI